MVKACRSTRSRAGVEPLEISKILLERDDIDVNLGRDDKGRTALSWACINDCLELVDLILKKDNIDPNVRDNTGRTPLAEACRSSVKPAVIRSLLSHRDTDPNAVDNNGVSPMAHFVKDYRLSAPPSEQAEIEALLLAAGAISNNPLSRSIDASCWNWFGGWRGHHHNVTNQNTYYSFLVPVVSPVFLSIYTLR